LINNVAEKHKQMHLTIRRIKSREQFQTQTNAHEYTATIEFVVRLLYDMFAIVVLAQVRVSFVTLYSCGWFAGLFKIKRITAESRNTCSGARRKQLHMCIFIRTYAFTPYILFQ